jgi:hypothetical protein
MPVSNSSSNLRKLCKVDARAALQSSCCLPELDSSHGALNARLPSPPPQPSTEWDMVAVLSFSRSRGSSQAVSHMLATTRSFLNQGMEEKDGRKGEIRATLVEVASYLYYHPYANSIMGPLNFHHMTQGHTQQDRDLESIKYPTTPSDPRFRQTVSAPL